MIICYHVIIVFSHKVFVLVVFIHVGFVQWKDSVSSANCGIRNPLDDS